MKIWIYSRLFRFYRSLGYSVGVAAHRAWRMAA